MHPIDYYHRPSVLARMTEFLGGTHLSDATCHYIARCRDATDPEFTRSPPGELPLFLSRGWDVGRSMWDATSLIVDLDVEYVNFDFPAEPFLDPARTFSLQQPVERAVEAIFSEIGLRPLHAITGRGHHFVWKVHRESKAFRRLARIGRIPPHMRRLYQTKRPSRDESVGLTLGRAFAGMGLVLEYMAHRILDQASSSCAVPVLPTAVRVDPQERGSEMVSVDISEYGDPLYTRVIRIPFSLYLKPWSRMEVMPAEIADRVPPMVMIPLGGLDLSEGIETMRDMEKAAEWASHTDCHIPDGSAEAEPLLELYLRSELRAFHDRYYSQEHDPADRWPSTYDRTPLERLPGFLQGALRDPNDQLLKPRVLADLTAELLGQGWHPRHIAGLVRSKYERDYGWLNEWYVYDAAMRADFYVRLFSGLIEVGPPGYRIVLDASGLPT